MQTPVEMVYVEEGHGRYQFYREHKYVSFVLNDLERLIAKTDFRVPVQVKKIQEELKSTMQLLQGHAEYEDSKLHPLLRIKGSNLFQEAEEDHQKHDALFQKLQYLLAQIQATSNEQLQIRLGYEFYLNYRRFVGENLLHLHEEETKILPELQKLYSDAELRNVEAETYQQMSIEDLVEMMQVLFPHFNPSDRLAFLHDIQAATPEKFPPVWETVKGCIDPEEQKQLIEKLSL
jgi:hemerythrin-like domain-containing protein